MCSTNTTKALYIIRITFVLASITRNWPVWPVHGRYGRYLNWYKTLMFQYWYTYWYGRYRYVIDYLATTTRMCGNIYKAFTSTNTRYIHTPKSVLSYSNILYYSLRASLYWFWHRRCCGRHHIGDHLEGAILPYLQRPWTRTQLHLDAPTKADDLHFITYQFVHRAFTLDFLGGRNFNTRHRIHWQKCYKRSRFHYRRKKELNQFGKCLRHSSIRSPPI